MKVTRRQKITIVSLVLYWVAIIILAHIQIPQVVYRAHVSDKWLHFLAYLGLVFLLWFSIKPDSKVIWLNRLVWIILFAVCAYGGLDEIIQPYFGRTCDLGDFLANDIGTVTGLIILTFLAFWQALPAVLAIIIFGVTNLAKADLSKLLPISDAVFHFFAYAGFTLCWIQFMRVYLPRVTVPWRLQLVIALPVCLLLAVKIASLLLDRHFAATDLLFAVSGICGVAIVSYLTGFIQPLPGPEAKGV